MGKLTDTVKTLIIANVLFFLGYQLVGEQAVSYLGLWFPANENFRFWQLLTHMFMHATFFHILFNMYALYLFGSLLERSIGQKQFLFIYFFSGLGAAGLQLLFSYFAYNTGYQDLIASGMTPSEISDLIHNAIQTGHFRAPQESVDAVRGMISAYASPMVGASGAVFGILAAFAVIYPNLPLYLFFVPVPIKAKYLIIGYFLIELFSGFSGIGVFGGSNVAHWAHVGGAIVGFITMWYWKKKQFNNNRWS